MTQSCKNCQHAKFQRRPSGRIVTTTAGECIAPSPVAIDAPVPSSMTVRVSRFAIWPADGEKCPAWLAK